MFFAVKVRSSKSHPVSANVDLAYSDGRLDAGALK